MTIQQNVKCVSHINLNQGRINQRPGVAKRHLFIRCENSSQNLRCSKTSTSYTCLTDIKVYSEQYNQSDISAER